MTEIIKAVGSLVLIALFSVQGYILLTSYSPPGMVFGPSDPWSGRFKVSGNTDNGDLKDGYLLLAKHDALDDKRQIRATVHATMEELLDEGEEKPDPEIADVFLDARALKVAGQECATAKQHLARDCSVIWAERVGEKQGNYYTFHVRLAFAETALLGDVEKSQAWIFGETTNPAFAGPESKTVSPRQTKQVRAEIYKQAAGICAKMRTRNQPCSVSGVDIRSRLNDSGSSAKIDGGAEYAFLTAASN